MRTSLLTTGLVPLLASFAIAQKLAVGADAPPLHVAKWIKGEPIESFAKGKICVVEFWATWCGPCIASMPHLSHLQAAFKDKGVTIVGVTSEDPNNPLAAVEQMVADKGDGMGYTVAWDDGRKTNEAYMKAAGQRGIPCSFVVDGAGKLAYIGHPMYLDFPLEGLVAGTWDPVAGGKRIADANRRLGALDKEIMADTDEGRAAVAAFCKEFPMLAQTVELMSFQVLLDAKKYDRASAVAASLVDKAVAAKDASALNGIAWPLVDPENAIERRDLELAMKAATKAVEISKEKDGNILDTLARVWFWKKDYQKALELQRKAVQVGDNPDLKKALAEYEKLVAEGAKKDGQ